MKHLQSKWFLLVYLMSLVGILAGTSLNPRQTPVAQTAKPNLNTGTSCEIDLANNSHTCGNIAAITFIQAPTNGETVLKINLDPNASGYTKANFQVEYSDVISGWTVNIGDSPTNNGFGGDAGTTSNAAEMQILNTTLDLYSNILDGYQDVTIDGSLHLARRENVVTPNSMISLEVSDERLGWQYGGVNDEFISPYLYTLNGQPTLYGDVNYDIYAAFNRTIWSANRNGLGVKRVTISLTLEITFPTIQSTNPLSHTHTAPSTTIVSISYDQSISPTTVSNQTFAVQAMQTGLLSGTYRVNGGTISLTPVNAFKAGELVQVSATTSTLNLLGQGPASPTVWQFWVEARNGSGTFTYNTNLGSSDWTQSLAAGDLDRDGDLDLVVGNRFGSDMILHNDGTGGFSDTAHNQGSSNTTDVALGDLNRDGYLDALMTNNSNSDAVWLNDGLGHLVNSGQSLGSGNTSAVALGDLDGDGDLDAYIAKPSGTADEVWYNDGTGTFSQSGQAIGSAFSSDVKLGDLDGDHDLDAFVSTCCTDIDRVWLNDGQGLFTTTAQTLASSSGEGVTLGDVDQDGDLDAVLGIATANKLLLNDGRGIFTDSGQSLGSSSTRDVVLGDLDADDDLDLLAINANNQANTIWLNDSSGSFSLTQSLSNTSSFAGTLADLDGNGSLDIVNGHYGSVNDVWLNGESPPVIALSFAKTVGMNPQVCSITNTISVTVNTEVTYCYQVTNTGNVTLTVHTLTDDHLGLLLNAFTYTLTPDSSYLYTTTSNLISDTINTALWTASDGTDAITVSGMATVTMINSAPLANDDSYSLDEDGSLTIAAAGVLANDTDADDDSLTAVLDNDVSHGNLTLNNDGGFSYTPDFDFNGTDSFTYHANDGQDASNTATVTITVQAVNDAPIAVDDSNNTDQDVAVIVNVLVNDSDVDGDSLVISAVGVPSNGTVVNNETTLTYFPTLGFTGTDSFTYTVSDGDRTATGTVTITVLPTPPCMTYGGLDLCTDTVLGNARIRVISKTLVISSETPHLSYGLSAQVNGFESALVTLEETDPANLPTGASIVVSATGTVNGLAQQPISSLRVEDVGAQMRLSADFSGLGVTTQTVVIYNGFEIVDILTDIPNPRVNIFTIEGCLLDPYWRMRDDIFAIMDFSAPVRLQINDRPVVEGTRVAFVAKEVADQVANLANIVMVGQHIPSFSILDIAVGMFHLPHRALGQAILQADNGTVAVGNIGSSGEDGVSVSLDQASNYQATLAPLNLVNNSEGIQVSAIGNVGGEIDIFLGSASFRNQDGMLQVEADYSPIGADGVYIEVLNNGQVVGTANVSSGLVGTITGNAAITQVAKLATNTSLVSSRLLTIPIILCNSVIFTGPVIFTTPVSSTPLTGNEIRLLALNASTLVSGLSRFNIQASNIQTFTILDAKVPNKPPLAGDDQATVRAGSSITVTVLSNDTDPDGDQLLITALGQPRNGQVVNNGADVTYTPTTGFLGTDTFTYTVSDGQGGFTMATVTVTVVNNPPVANDDTATTFIDTPITVAVLSNDSDPDGDSLVISAVGAPSNGTLVNFNNGTVINNETTLTYSPALGFKGTDSFTYTVSDGQGGVDTATVSITVTNRPPIAVDDQATTAINTALSLDVLANDSDPDGDTLSISTVSLPDQGGNVVINGTRLDYTPASNFVGTELFSYTISDGSGGQATATVTLQVQAPDLAIDKALPWRYISPDYVYLAYRITISNLGNLATDGPILVTDTLPADLNFDTSRHISTWGRHWSCQIVSLTVTCTRSQALSPDDSTEIRLRAYRRDVPPLPDTITNCATVSTAKDVNLGNNTACEEITIPKGSISGAVTDAAGKPIQNVWVYAHTENWSAYGRASVDASGLYTITNLMAGDYRVQFWHSSWPRIYHSEYYDNISIYQPNSATFVTVLTNTKTADIDAVLDEILYGDIIGKVTSVDGQTLSNIQVYARRLYNDRWIYRSAGRTDSQGNYTLANLEVTSYTLEFIDHSYTHHDEFYNGVRGITQATPVDVLPNTSITSSVDLEPIKMGSITGTLVSPSGEGLRNFEVYLISAHITRDDYRGDSGFGVNRNWFSWARSHRGIYLVRTDEAGNFSTEVPIGPYKILASNPENRLHRQYYQNDSRLEAATVVTVTEVISGARYNKTQQAKQLPTGVLITVSAPPNVTLTSGNIPWGIAGKTDFQITANLTSENPSCPSGSTLVVKLEIRDPNSPGDVLQDFVMVADPPNSNTYILDPAPKVSELKEGDTYINWYCRDDDNGELSLVGGLGTSLGGIDLYDPAGYITDAVTDRAITEATVSLYKVPDWGPKQTPVDDRPNTCQSHLSKLPNDPWNQTAPITQGILANPDPSVPEFDPLINPQLTNSEGHYKWDVAEGCWYVIVEAEGYQTKVSPVVGVPPEVTDLDLALRPDPTANLSLTKAVTPTQVQAGGVLTYTITLSNSVGAAATGIVLTDTLPNGLTFGGWVVQGEATKQDNIITWQGAISSQTQLKLIYTTTVKLDLPSQALTNTVQIQGENQISFSSSTSVSVSAVPDPRRYPVYLPLVMK